MRTAAAQLGAVVVVTAAGVPVLLLVARHHDSLLGIGLLAVCVALAVVVRPLVALLLLIAVVVTNVSAVAGAPLYLVAVLLACTAIALSAARHRMQLGWSPVFLFALVFLAVRGLSVFVATDQSLALTAVADHGKELLVLPLVALLASTGRRAAVAARLAVGCLAGLAALSVLHEVFGYPPEAFGGLSQALTESDVGGATARHSGPTVDPNFWAQTLTLFFPLAVSLAVVDRRSRWLWVAAGALIGVGVYLTGSRGGLLGLAVGVIAWLLLRGGWQARTALVAPLIVVPLLAVPGLGSRLATLVDVGAAAEGAGDSSLVGRVVAQRAGLAMFAEHPVTGVGAGNFGLHQPDYARQLGLVDAQPRAAHNLYLQMAAEGGLPTLAGWLLFFGAAVFVGIRARILLGLRDPPAAVDGQSLVVGLMAGMAAWAFSSLFLHLVTFRSFLVVAGLTAALDLQARRHTTRHPAGHVAEAAA
jgi:O-antigen ligase